MTDHLQRYVDDINDLIGSVFSSVDEICATVEAVKTPSPPVTCRIKVGNVWKKIPIGVSVPETIDLICGSDGSVRTITKDHARKLVWQLRALDPCQAKEPADFWLAVADSKPE